MHPEKSNSGRTEYSVWCKCKNCGHIGSLRLPKGVAAPQKGIGSMPVECPTCGCREYVRDR